jgi:hypothetical protein
MWFCTELVALTLEELGILNLLKPASTYIPKDFAKKIKGLRCEYSYDEIEIIAYNI